MGSHVCTHWTVRYYQSHLPPTLLSNHPIGADGGRVYFIGLGVGRGRYSEAEIAALPHSVKVKSAMEPSPTEKFWCHCNFGFSHADKIISRYTEYLWHMSLPVLPRYIAMNDKSQLNFISRLRLYRDIFVIISRFESGNLRTKLQRTSN